MPKPPYSDEEVRRYFQNPSARRASARPGAPSGQGGDGARREAPKRSTAPADPKGQALWGLKRVLLGVAILVGIGLVALGALAFTLPGLEAIEKPDLSRSAVAYTADGVELARYYAGENRLWVPYDSISAHVVEALVSTEDKRFYDHWGIDVLRTAAIPYHVLTGNPQGGSTITQQLARNLYKTIGRDRSVVRKLKEWMTAVQIERRYTKREIIEMYLNTVEFGANAWGIQSASQTFFSKDAAGLDVLESATLVGMLQAVSRYNPVRNPENAQRRRNIVLSLMVENGKLAQADFNRLREQPVRTEFRSFEITKSIAPYFAMYVQDWLKRWAKEAGHDENFIYQTGLVVTTTLDSRLQQRAQAAVDAEMPGLQAVVDYEWSRQNGYSLGQDVQPYVRAARNVEPFAYFWNANPRIVNEWLKGTDRFRELRASGVDEDAALQQLRRDEAFADSLRARKTRLETGLIAVDPNTGYVKTWVGGRDLKMDWYDHVVTARRQPGSTFKPFVYTVAIDNGYAPDQAIGGGPFTWVGEGPCRGQRWSPGNMGGGGNKSLRSALATSDNFVTARLVTQVNPRNVALYAQRMGITSPLIPQGVRAECYMSLALGTSDVNLFELSAAYATLANGGLYNEPTVVTRIEDRFGNVLYEAEPKPREALTEETAYTVVDMMRGAVQHGTAVRLKSMYGLGSLDLAAKTGTTQGNADGWFMAMHPELVVGAWVGFNDRRIAFRSTFWGQGAHNAMYVVGNFLKRVQESPVALDAEAKFPEVQLSRFEEAIPATDAPDPVQVDRENRPTAPADDPEQGRVDW
jgi:penicillin-binding protein 1A